MVDTKTTGPSTYLDEDGKLIIPEEISIKGDGLNTFGTTPLKWAAIQEAVGTPPLRESGLGGQGYFFEAKAYIKADNEYPDFVIQFPWAWTNMVMASLGPAPEPRFVDVLQGFVGMARVTNSKIDYTESFFVSGPLAEPEFSAEVARLMDPAVKHGYSRITLIPNASEPDNSSTDINELMLLAQYYEWLQRSNKLTPFHFQYGQR